jgi:type I restriction enzyme M protein
MARSKKAPVPPVGVAVGAIPEGKVVDFLTGKYVKDTPEEYVRQNLERAIVRQYRYPAADCAPEFRIKVGSAKKRVDIAIFSDNAKHTQENISIIVETKRAGTSPQDKKDGIGQLQSYMAACVNAEYGLWTNGDDRFCFAKRASRGSFKFEEILDIPAAGQSEAEAQQPKRKDLTHIIHDC